MILMSLVSQIVVHIYIDKPAGNPDATIGAFTTNVLRPDVNIAMGGIEGKHGFSVTIPNKFYDGNLHPVYAYGIDLNDPSSNSNKELLGSPKEFEFVN